MAEHLILFDDTCPFCHRAVKHILEIDEEKEFIFAPLRGETAHYLLSGPQRSLLNVNSLVFIENYQSTMRRFWIRSHAIYRIYWLIGNGWGLIGCLSFLPQWLGDFFYRWLAEHRHQFKLYMPEEAVPEDRLLP